MQTFAQYLPILYFFTAMATGSSFLFITWKQGSYKASNEVIKTYKEQVEQLKDQITTFQKQIDTMQKDVNQMQAVIGEKEKQNKDLRDLLLARNPHVEQFYTEALPILENMKIFMARLDTYLKDTSVQAHKQTDELQTQTDLLKKIA